MEQAAPVSPSFYLAASGTKMFIVMNNRCSLVYDTDTAVLGVGTHAPPRMVFGFGICMPVGEVLYLLSYRLSENDGPQSFEAMSWSPAAATADVHRPSDRRLPRAAPGRVHQASS